MLSDAVSVIGVKSSRVTPLCSCFKAEWVSAVAFAAAFFMSDLAFWWCSDQELASGSSAREAFWDNLGSNKRSENN